MSNSQMLLEEGRRKDVAKSHLKQSSMELAFSQFVYSLQLSYFSCTEYATNQKNGLAFPQCRWSLCPLTRVMLVITASFLVLRSLSVQTREQECKSASPLKLSRGKCGSGHCLALGLPLFLESRLDSFSGKRKVKPLPYKVRNPLSWEAWSSPNPFCANPRGLAVLSI